MEYMYLAAVDLARRAHKGQLRNSSSFPEKVDYKLWHNFIIDVVENYLTPLHLKGYR